MGDLALETCYRTSQEELRKALRVLVGAADSRSWSRAEETLLRGFEELDTLRRIVRWNLRRGNGWLLDRQAEERQDQVERAELPRIHTSRWQRR